VGDWSFGNGDMQYAAEIKPKGRRYYSKGANDISAPTDYRESAERRLPRFLFD